MTWFIPRSIQLAFAPASECSTSASTQPSNISDSNPVLWVTLSGTPTLRPVSWRGWMTRPWSRRLFGPETCRMSDGNAGLDAWTESLRAFRASPTAWQAAGKGRKTTDGRGPRLSNPFAWLDQDSHSWKTSPDCDLLGDWMPYLQTWPRSGCMQSGTVYELQTWAPATSGSGFSFWPTATVHGNNNRAGSSATAGDGLQIAVSMWQTSAIPKGGLKSRGGSRRHALLLAGQAPQWATPTASDSEQCGTTRSAHFTLHCMTKNWPTPAARDYRSGYDERERSNGPTLTNTVQDFSRQARMQESGPTSSISSPSSPLRLNPAFACWLMGWPWWWTNPDPISFAASEMELWRSRLLSHLSRLLGEQESQKEEKHERVA